MLKIKLGISTVSNFMTRALLGSLNSRRLRDVWATEHVLCRTNVMSNVKRLKNFLSCHPLRSAQIEVNNIIYITISVEFSQYVGIHKENNYQGPSRQLRLILGLSEGFTLPCKGFVQLYPLCWLCRGLRSFWSALVFIDNLSLQATTVWVKLILHTFSWALPFLVWVKFNFLHFFWC